MNGTITLPDEILAKYTNDTKPPYHCKKCDRPFSKIMGLKMHFIRSHTNKNWDSSGNFRPSSNGPEDHQERQVVKKRAGYQCPFCEHPPFKSEGGVRYHTVTHHGRTASGKTGAKCPECGYQSSPQGVALHRSLKHGVEGVFGKLKKHRGGVSKGRALQIAAMEAPVERKPRTASEIFGTKEDERVERRSVHACPHCALNLDDVRGVLQGRELAFCPVDGVDIAEIEEVINR